MTGNIGRKFWKIAGRVSDSTVKELGLPTRTIASYRKKPKKRKRKRSKYITVRVKR